MKSDVPDLSSCAPKNRVIHRFEKCAVYSCSNVLYVQGKITKQYQSIIALSATYGDATATYGDATATYGDAIAHFTDTYSGHKMWLMAKTLQVASDRAYDETKTVLPAEVARGVYIENPPSAEALKLMHLLINKAAGRMAEDRHHELRLAEIKAIKGMRNHSRDTLRSLFKELRSTVLIYDDTKEQCEIIGGFMDEVCLDYRHEVNHDLLIKWYFSRTFRRMAAASCHWAIMDRQTIFALSSKYSILLFQHIASLKNLSHINSKTFTIPELRAVLGIEDGRLERFSHTNRRALQPCLSEISQLSRLTLWAELHKVGRSVASVTIFWEEKDYGQKSDAQRELDRPKVGRQARRESRVDHPAEDLEPETVAASDAVPKPPPETERMAFPRSGSVKGSTPWEALAREHVTRLQGNHLPDLLMLSEQFRAWCRVKSIPLDMNGIEAVFTGFCRSYRPPL